MCLMLMSPTDPVLSDSDDVRLLPKDACLLVDPRAACCCLPLLGSGPWPPAPKAGANLGKNSFACCSGRNVLGLRGGPPPEDVLSPEEALSMHPIPLNFSISGIFRLLGFKNRPFTSSPDSKFDVLSHSLGSSPYLALSLLASVVASYGLGRFTLRV